MKLFAALCLVLWAGASQAACRQALALGLDVSGSVDSAEYQVQLNGLANALLHPEVQEALLVMPQTPVRLAVFEWSGPEFKRVLLPWTEISGHDALAQAAARIRGSQRVPADPSTAIGAAMRFGLGMLGEQPACWKRTLDLSGDGVSNTGPRPKEIRPLAEATDITVNGLVIAADAPEGRTDQRAEVAALWSYYKVYVISGPGAFVETALGFEDFEAAMVRKLKKELQGQLFSSLLPVQVPMANQ